MECYASVQVSEMCVKHFVDEIKSLFFIKYKVQLTNRIEPVKETIFFKNILSPVVKSVSPISWSVC